MVGFVELLLCINIIILFIASPYGAFLQPMVPCRHLYLLSLNLFLSFLGLLLLF
jgi:hypothetical protein